MPVRHLLALLSLLLFAPVQAADVDALLAQMTLDEKLSLLHGHLDPQPETGFNSAGYLPGVPRLGIPPLRLADGPAGIRSDRSATALPAPVMLAASFDPALALRYGAVIGREGIARNQQILLSPMVNLVRVPQAGRNFETFGEDPLLASAIVAAEITGIQQEGMLATVKHFAVNNQETARLTLDAVVDERTLRELYLPAFEAAVQAGVAAVMCAYNRVNGTYACENAQLLNDILRGDWGFQGFVMTDWWANHSLAALTGGLNLEMPGWQHRDYEVLVHFDAPLREALTTGRLREADVDTALRPLLRTLDRFGYLQATPPVAASAPQHDVALETALAGAVLLRNEQNFLPLAASELGSTLLVGPTAQHTLVGGGGSSRVLPERRDQVREALGLLGGGAEPRYHDGFAMDGLPVPDTVLYLPGSNRRGVQFTAANGNRRRLGTIEHMGSKAVAGVGMWYWYTDLIAPETGDYEFHVQTDGPVASLYLDDQRVLWNDKGIVADAELLPTADGLRNSSTVLALEAGQRYRLKVEAWTGDRQPLQVRLRWLPPSAVDAVIGAAVAAADGAERILVFAHQEGTETRDRSSLALPGLQDEVIAALARRFPGKVGVVLSTGAPVTMPWAEDVAAILQTWYPGQAGGEATARLLLGLATPGGRLPVTFPRSERDTPQAGNPLRFPGVDQRQLYGESRYIGYRWYDKRALEPLFAFGHGLSYTTFDYGDLSLQQRGNDVEVSFTVHNRGARDGADVPQLYLSQPESPVDVEVRKLVGFQRVDVAAGSSVQVTLLVPARAFAYWHTAEARWEPLPGRKQLLLGASSRDLRLQQEFVYSPAL